MRFIMCSSQTTAVMFGWDRVGVGLLQQYQTHDFTSSGINFQANVRHHEGGTYRGQTRPQTHRSAFAVDKQPAWKFIRSIAQPLRGLCRRFPL